MEALAEIQLGEDGEPLQPSGQIRKVGARVEVRLRLKIEQPVVSTWPPCAICLLHHMEKRGPVAAGPSDDPLLLQLSELLLGSLQPDVVEPPVLGRDWAALRPWEVLHAVCGPGQHLGGVEQAGELLQGGRIIDNLQIDNLQIDNRQIDNQPNDNQKITFFAHFLL